MPAPPREGPSLSPFESENVSAVDFKDTIEEFDGKTWISDLQGHADDLATFETSLSGVGKGD
jgi:hypothetical protein